MTVVLVLVPAAVTLGALFLWLFVQSVRHGQFDDLDDPPIRILFDDDRAPPPSRPRTP